MKRFISLSTLTALLLFFGTLLYVMVPGFSAIPKLGPGIKKIRKNTGTGVLFDRESSVVSREVVYRFYKNGSWKSWEKMQEPLYEEYSTTGNYAALKHCRLEGNLIYFLYRSAEVNGAEKMKKIRFYRQFMSHLLLAHNEGAKPDSVQVAYYYLDNNAHNRLPLINFKVKP